MTAALRWLVTGSAGQVGTDLVTQLTSAGQFVHAVDADELDITDGASVDAAVSEVQPHVIVNAAAYTNVDGAEADEDTAHLVNAAGPAFLATAAARAGARLLHLSTDYVFSGEASRPYEVDDAPDPQSVYGRTKLAGEVAVREILPDASWVVRTSWVYGRGANFVRTMIGLEQQRDTVSVVDDQWGSPTSSASLARGLIELVTSDVDAGIYHCTNTGHTTWYAFARAVFEELGADPERVRPIATAEYPTAAARPSYSVLSDARWRAAGLRPLPPWHDALHTAFVSGAFAPGQVVSG